MSVLLYAESLTNEDKENELSMVCNPKRRENERPKYRAFAQVAIGVGDTVNITRRVLKVASDYNPDEWLCSVALNEDGYHITNNSTNEHSLFLQRKSTDRFMPLNGTNFIRQGGYLHFGPDNKPHRVLRLPSK